MRAIIFLLLVCVPRVLFADNDTTPTGARADGMAKASVALVGLWSSFYNQATLALLQKKSIAVYCENRFDLNEISNKAICVNMPTQRGTFAINYLQYGFELYKESKIGIAYAKTLGKHLWMGIQINRITKKMPIEDGSQTRYSFDFGVLTEIKKQLFIGFHISNPTKTSFRIEQYITDCIPTVARLGVCYYFNKNSLIAGEINKDIAGAARLKIGAEYTVVKNISVRIGVANHPNSVSMGGGFNYSPFDINIAFSKHPVLGYTPSVDLSYQF